MFKKYLRASITDSSEKLKNPFLRLNIKCPRASYDANVEPAKDNVLFGNESLVMEAIEQLFKETYGECIAPPPTLAPQVLNKQLDNFEVLLARKPQTPPPNNLQSDSSMPISSSNSSGQPLAAPSPTNTQTISQPSDFLETKLSPDEQPGSKRRKWSFDMSNDYTEEVEGYERRGSISTSTSQNSQISEHESPFGSKSTLNPWLIAKMNAPVSRNNVSASHAPRQENDVGFNSVSRLNVVPGNRPRQTFHRDDILASPSSRNLTPQILRDKSLPVDNRLPVPRTFEDDLFLVEAEPQLPPKRRNDFVSARNMSEAALISPPATTVSKSRRGPRELNMPFVTPQRTAAHRRPADEMFQTTLSIEHQPQGHRNVIKNPAQYANTNSDLAWAMEFEQRKEDATRQRRMELRAARQAEDQAAPTGPTRSSPHKNRYIAASASLNVTQTRLEPSRPPKEPFKTTLNEDDPRAYLMRRKKSMAAQSIKPGDPPRMMRAKSMKLPMEKIFPDESLYRLLQLVHADIGALKGMVEVLAKEDVYMGHGREFPGLAIEDSHIPAIAKKLQMTVTSWIGSEAENGHKHEVEFSFGNLPSVRSLDNVA